MMPLLDFNDLNRMFALPPITCCECGRETYQNYCRECDEYYRVGHSPDCTLHGEHSGHRIYPTLPTIPFSTRTTDWAIYLDPLRQNHIWIEHAAIRSMFGETILEPGYLETFMEMGDRALEWVEKATHKLLDGKVYAMHFAGSDLDLRIGVIGGQLILLMPRTEFE